MSARLRRGAYGLPVDLSQVAFDWGSQGYGCGRHRDPAGRRWEDLVHRRDELVLVVRGQLELAAAGEIIDLGPGDQALVPAGLRHSLRNRARGETLWLSGQRS